jgi:hypothetical protein
MLLVRREVPLVVHELVGRHAKVHAVGGLEDRDPVQGPCLPECSAQ